MGAPFSVIVAAIGTPRSPAVRVNVVFDTDESATVAVMCW